LDSFVTEVLPPVGKESLRARKTATGPRSETLGHHKICSGERLEAAASPPELRNYRKMASTSLSTGARHAGKASISNSR
jgi:hypothetical protein